MTFSIMGLRVDIDCTYEYELTAVIFLHYNVDAIKINHNKKICS